MKHNKRQTAENNVGGHLLGMNSMLIRVEPSGDTVSLGTEELHPDTCRQFDSRTRLQTSVPRRSRQGFLNDAGTWAMNKGC